MRRPTLLAGVLVAALGLGCGGDSTGPTAGQLSLRLTTPNADDGAVLVLISGGPIESVSGAAGYQAYSAVLGRTSARVLVTGNVTSGVIATVAVPDVRQAGNYSAFVEQAAARDGDHALQSVTGYSAVVN